MPFKSTLITCFMVFIYSTVSFSQQLKSTVVYEKRAEEMYNRIWKYYRVPKFTGLFSEYYPSANGQQLTYFQGNDVQEKKVSFLWPFSGMFSATNVLLRSPKLHGKYLLYLDSLGTGIEQYRDTIRKPVGYQAYPSILEHADRYYDDNGLVGIDYCQAYLNTKNPVYLKRAKEVFEFILSGWDDQLNGGVYWLEGHKDQKPACSNGMATLTALKLYECTRDAYYLDWGKKFYNWMHDHLRNPEGIYYNDVKMDGIPNKVYYTYNTGSMLEAAVLLYCFTKDHVYLTEARLIAENSFKHFSRPGNNGQPVFQVDLPWFLTVLFRGYEALYRIDGNPKYVAAVIRDLDIAWEKSRDKYGLLTEKWKQDETAKTKPKWLLDEACIAELYARASLLKIKSQ